MILPRLLVGAVLVSAAAVTLAPALRAAPPRQADQLEVEGAWVRLLPPGSKNTGAFFSVKNRGRAEVRLVSARADVVDRAELHTHLHENGVMKMRQVPHIEVKAGETVRLAPGGLHVMLFGLKAPLVEGQVVKLTVGLADGSTLALDAVVAREAPVAAPPPQGSEPSRTSKP